MFDLRWLIITQLQISGSEKSEQLTMSWENIVWENDVHHVPDHTDHRGGEENMRVTGVSTIFWVSDT